MTATPLPPMRHGKPEALRIADELDDHNANLDRRARKELRRQHAENQHLETMNAQLREQNTEVDAACAKLEAENAKLREVLERLRHWAEGDRVNYINDHPVALARAALENKP